MGRFIQYGPAHKILVLMAYAQKPPLSIHALISCGVRGLIFGLSSYTSCMPEGKSLVRLYICAGLSESSLLANLISANVLCACPYGHLISI